MEIFKKIHKLSIATRNNMMYKTKSMLYLFQTYSYSTIVKRTLNFYVISVYTLSIKTKSAFVLTLKMPIMLNLVMHGNLPSTTWTV